MTRIGAVVAGLLLVVIDVRIFGLDVLPDLAGWVLAAITLNKLRGRSELFRTAAIMSAVAGAFSITELQRGRSAAANTVAGAPVGLQAVSLYLYAIAVFVAVVTICLAIRSAALAAEDTAAARLFQVIAAAVAIVNVCALVVFANSGTEQAESGGGIAVLLVLAVLVVYGWMLFALFGLRKRDYLSEV